MIGNKGLGLLISGHIQEMIFIEKDVFSKHVDTCNGCVH